MGVQNFMAKNKENTPPHSDGFNWAKIRSEYVTKNFTYSALCDKYGCSMSTLTKKASAEKWAEARKKHRKKVERKTEEKIASRKAEQNAAELSRCVELADTLLEWLEKAISELDEHAVMSKEVTKKTKYLPAKGKEKRMPSKETVTEKVDISVIKSIVKTDDLKKLASTLKDIRDVIATGEESDIEPTLKVILEGDLKDYGA